MMAGFVAVPTIVPLKAFFAGERKNRVDTTTKIELSSGTAHAKIFIYIFACMCDLYLCRNRGSGALLHGERQTSRTVRSTKTQSHTGIPHTLHPGRWEGMYSI